MKYIKSDISIMRNPKVVHLATLLGIRKSHAIGHLHALWHAVLEVEESGDISSWTDEMIAQYADYEGDPKEFTRLLIEHKFIDVEPKNEPSSKKVHNWYNYAGEYLRNKYKSSDPDKLSTIESLHKNTGVIPVKHRSFRHIDKTRLDKTRLDKNITTSEGSFSKFWDKYPKKQGRQKALDSWLKLSPDETLIAEILKSIEAHSRAPQWIKDDGQYIPLPATWLNQRRWEDELEVKQEFKKQENRILSSPQTDTELKSYCCQAVFTEDKRCSKCGEDYSPGKISELISLKKV